MKLYCDEHENLQTSDIPIAHEIQRVESPTAISQICLRLVSSSVALVRWPDNRTRGRRLRAGFIFHFRQGRSGAVGEKRCQNCAWAADENVAIPGRAKLLRRAGCARTADGSIAQMGPHNASRIKGVPAY